METVSHVYSSLNLFAMNQKHPKWLLPNLLSLDAPIVAVVWAWMFAQSWRVQWVNANIYLLLPGVVWIIYCLDRYLDNKVSENKRGEHSARHAFHQRHWWWFRIGIYIVAGFCAATLLQLPLSIFFHAIPILILVCVYFFTAVFSEHRQGQPQLFKNAIAGFTFSYGTAMGVFFFRPSSYWLELVLTQQNLLFALLCTCNITAIDLWEASRATAEREGKKYYELSLTIPLFILVTLSFLLAVRADDYSRPFYFAIMIAGGLLQVINHYRSRFSLNTLRAFADLALLVPAPIFWLYLQALS